MSELPELRIVPCSFQQACDFVDAIHRHHKPPVGHKWSMAVADGRNLVRGVAMCGRPVSRHLDDGYTFEVNRVATDGCPNACSCLYGASRRVGFALGYRRGVTYTLPSESGSSLRGAGWVLDKEDAGGGSWDAPSRPREDHAPMVSKCRWIVERDVSVGDLEWPDDVRDPTILTLEEFSGIGSSA